MLALGNGGSATDAQDAVADLRAPPARVAVRGARSTCAEDPAILTAIANDIGVEAIFARQVIAYGREGDVALVASPPAATRPTSSRPSPRRAGAACARWRWWATTAAGWRHEGLADIVVVTRSEHIPRIQEAQASAWHVVRELVEHASP